MTGVRHGSSVRHALLGIILVLGLGLVAQGGWGLAKARLAQILLERAFRLTLSTGVPQKPWPWADTRPMARIEVPRLGISAIALDGGSGQALAFGPGHLDQSGDVGALDTAVFAAHRDTHFWFLGALVAGDVIRVTGANGHVMTFRVTERRIVTWNAFSIDRHPGRPMLALATCWPLTTIQPGPLRLVVLAEALPGSGVAAR